MKKSRKKLFIVIITIIAIIALFLLFFVIEFPSLAHVEGGCSGEPPNVLCVEPCRVQTLFTILVDGC